MLTSSVFMSHEPRIVKYSSSVFSNHEGSFYKVVFTLPVVIARKDKPTRSSGGGRAVEEVPISVGRCRWLGTPAVQEGTPSHLL